MQLEDMAELHQLIDSFKPTEDVLKFFATKRGQNEVRQKLSELKTEQKNFEEVLRNEVRNNYQVFLQTNEEIKLVEKNVTDLKYLIDDTTDLVKNLKGLDIMNNMTADNYDKVSLPASDISSSNNELIENLNISSSTTNTKEFPNQVMSAVDEVDKFIILQQYQAAVDLILYVRNYRAGVDINFQKILSKSNMAKISNTKYVSYLKQYDKLKEICYQVEEKATKLTELLNKSLPNLARSQIWGYEEHSRRLKMLVSLGQYQLAAQAFCKSQKDLVNRSVTSFQSTGDSFEYISMMSQTFFTLLYDSTQLFMELFSSEIHESIHGQILKLDTIIMTHLLDWIQQQIISYVKVIVTQMKIGIHEKSSNLFILLRSKYTILSPRNNIPTISPDRSNTAVANTSGQSVSSTPNSYDISTYNEDKRRYENTKKEGPLLFLSSCLHVMCSYSQSLRSYHLQGNPYLFLHAMSDIKESIELYSDAVLKEIIHTVNQDPWQEYECTHALVPSPPKLRAKYDSYPNPPLTMQNTSLSHVPVPIPTTPQSATTSSNMINKSKSQQSSKKYMISQSYDWMIQYLALFFEDVWVLLQVEDTSTQTDTITTMNKKSDISSSSSSSYQRIEIAEVERILITCLLRIVARYCMELESLASLPTIFQVFSTEQITCLINTMKTVVVSLLPSVNGLLNSTFNTYYTTTLSTAISGSSSSSSSGQETTTSTSYDSTTTTKSPNQEQKNISSSVSNIESSHLDPSNSEMMMKASISILEKYPPQTILQALCQRVEEKGKFLLTQLKQ